MQAIKLKHAFSAMVPMKHDPNRSYSNHYCTVYEISTKSTTLVKAKSLQIHYHIITIKRESLAQKKKKAIEKKCKIRLTN